MPRFDLPVRVTDYVWLGLAVLFAMTGAAGLYAWGIDAMGRPYTLSELFWVLVGLAALVGSAALLVLLSWRRTCWGAPAGSARERRDSDAGERG